MNTSNTNKKTGSGINLFKIAGIQINIDVSWFIIFLLVLWSLSAGYFPRQFPDQSAQIYWGAGLVATLLFFFSVLFHEMSHSLMAQRCGIEISEIKLFIFGGVAKLSEESKNPLTEFKIAVVGPLSSFVLAIFFWICHKLLGSLNFPMAQAVTGYLVWINMALGIFNLLPGFPLDGGRILRAILWYRTGSLSRATKWASDVGKGLAIALMVLGAIQIFSGMLIGGLWLIFIGMFLRGVAEGGYQEVLMRQSLEDVQVREVMIEDVVSIQPELTVRELVTDYFLKYGYKGFPVMESGKVIGVVSLAEIKNIERSHDQTTRVVDIMLSLDNTMVTSPDTSLVIAMRKMMTENLARLLVMENNQLLGMITKTGLMRFLEIKNILEDSRPTRNISHQ
ncbi:MAG: site-2 protease family protein [Desulfobacterales bacterium]|nr:site-2 protease family protein [Desulfobacterales bacterium]